MTTPMPEPLSTETDEEYRDRLRAWYDAIPSTNTPELRQAEWEYIASLQGVEP